jgi:nicotinamidase-related amidase
VPRSSDAAPTAPSRDAGRGGAALLIVDMINDFAFAGGARLRSRAEAICDPILDLRGQAEAVDAPVIYVNDNFGQWHSEKSLIVRHARERGGPMIDRIAPLDRHYFVIKPQFSGFYATNLPLLLPKLGVSRLVLTGAATDICVLFTAADAHMRDYALWIPADAVAAQTDARSAGALKIARESMNAETACTRDLRLTDWLANLTPVRSFR